MPRLERLKIETRFGHRIRRGGSSLFNRTGKNHDSRTVFKSPMVDFTFRTAEPPKKDFPGGGKSNIFTFVPNFPSLPKSSASSHTSSAGKLATKEKSKSKIRVEVEEEMAPVPKEMPKIDPSRAIEDIIKRMVGNALSPEQIKKIEEDAKAEAQNGLGSGGKAPPIKNPNAPSPKRDVCPICAAQMPQCGAEVQRRDLTGRKDWWNHPALAHLKPLAIHFPK